MTERRSYGYICGPTKGLLTEDGTTLFEKIATGMGLERDPNHNLCTKQNNDEFIIQDVTPKGSETSAKMVYVAVTGNRFNEFLKLVDEAAGGKLLHRSPSSRPPELTESSIEILPAPPPSCTEKRPLVKQIRDKFQETFDKSGLHKLP